VVSAVALEDDDPVAPRGIDLDFDARNIVTGKWRRTQSSHVANLDAADARPSKKGALISK
jgi:hypothetical protein